MYYYSLSYDDLHTNFNQMLQPAFLFTNNNSWIYLSFSHITNISISHSLFMLETNHVVEISCYTEDIYIKIRRNIFIIYLHNKYLKRLIFISLFNELYVSFIRFCVFTWRTHACEYICINKSLKKNLFTYPPDGSSKINNSIIIEL